MYRLVHHFRMSDLIFTHISARLPGPGHRFLINRYGLLFDEITASNLVVVDLDGELVGSPEEATVNPPDSWSIPRSTEAGRTRPACCTPTPAPVALSRPRTGCCR